MFETTFGIAGTLLAWFALFIIFKAWKDKAVRQDLRILGWGLMLLSLIIWAFATGKDRGVAIGLIVICLSALMIITIQAYPDKSNKKHYENRQKKKTAKPVYSLKLKGLVRRASIIAWVTLGCAAVSFVVAMGLHELLWQSGVHASNSLVIVLFIFPILWAACSAFSLISQNIKLKAGVFTAVPVLALIVLIGFNSSIAG